MKKIILSIFTFFAISTVVNAQQWETIGSEGFTSGDTQYGCMDVYNGTPYIAYKDVANGSKCTVMRYNGTNWVFVGQQAFTPGIAREQSIAIDQQNGNVYIEYTDATINSIIVSSFNDNNGIWEPLGLNGVASSPGEFYQQIKIDNGIPYLVYGGYQASIKKFTSGSPGSWAPISAPVISMAQAWFTRMAVGGSDQYVIYSDMASSGKASVAKINASSVSAVGGTLGFTSGGVGYTDIALDNSIPYISYQDSSVGRKISVMKFDGTSWVYVGNQGISSGNVENTRILTHNSIPYIAYFDESDGNIHIKKFNGTNWVSVGSAVSNGQLYLNDMVINNDYLFVAYKDGALGGKMTVKKIDLNSINSIEGDKKVVLKTYPNPAQNQLFIDVNDLEINEIEILDYSGKLVKSIIDNFSNNIDISDLKTGAYILRIMTKDGVSTNQFIKH